MQPMIKISNKNSKKLRPIKGEKQKTPSCIFYILNFLYSVVNGNEDDVIKQIGFKTESDKDLLEM